MTHLLPSFVFSFVRPQQKYADVLLSKDFLSKAQTAHAELGSRPGPGALLQRGLILIQKTCSKS